MSDARGLPWTVYMACGHTAPLCGNPKVGGYLTCLDGRCHGQRRIVAVEFCGAACKSCGHDIPRSQVHGPHYDLCLRCRGARIPARCPYKAGDRVQVHGYPGGFTELDRTGWRGTVEGYLGATILTAFTDDGREWAGSWGSLDREGTPPHDRVLRCTCCPCPEVQGALFDALTAP
jgi:hypothetical protein